MKVVGSYELKTELASILRHVAREGSEYLITNRGIPVAKIIPIENEMESKKSKLHAKLQKLQTDTGINLSDTEIIHLIEETRK